MPLRCATPAGSPYGLCTESQNCRRCRGGAPLPLNFGPVPARLNAPQRPVSRPAEIERLGHVVLGTTRFGAALDWYLDTLGLIVSDFLYLDGQRERGPVMAFTRCDQGAVPADHHTLAMLLAPHTGYVHSAYQLTDLDEVGASGQYLRERGYRHAWGIGRHIQGSQIFDYWRDTDRLMFEHYADGDVFDSSVPPGWAPLSASGLAQRGPKATAEFTGTRDAIALAGGPKRVITLSDPAAADYGVTLSQPTPDRAPGALDETIALLADGRLRLRAHTTMPMQQAAEAHRQLESGAVHQRIILTLN